MRFRNISAITLFIVLVGCTSIQVQPIDRSINLKHVCIEENPKVIVADFVTVIRDGFDRHGISTEVFSGSTPDRCEYVLTYTALQSWDFSTYLSYAELRLESKGRKIASAEYRLRGKGGLSMMKWQGTKTKMDPVIDELLKAY
ncbi:Sbal_3080 family lipoprotein [Chitinivorax sp. B]|uniref:Sbal_3080 family lipoprotein n=1 Tax=Chitinivorax sp. B TaxID=2502235 RepID=UPI0010F6BD24|nr:Sbal_3080 family lipoprotein [Chitinivorax sp. B]